MQTLVVRLPRELLHGQKKNLLEVLACCLNGDRVLVVKGEKIAFQVWIHPVLTLAPSMSMAEAMEAAAAFVACLLLKL